MTATLVSFILIMRSRGGIFEHELASFTDPVWCRRECNLRNLQGGNERPCEGDKHEAFLGGNRRGFSQLERLREPEKASSSLD